MSSHYIASKLRPVVQHLLDNKVKIVAVVTDNEATMRNGAGIMNTEFGILDIPCAAHTIQLIVKDLFNVEFISAFNEHINKLLHGYKTDKDVKRIFYDGNDIQLKHPNTTSGIADMNRIRL